MVIRIGLIQLEHRELGVVLRRHPLVAEISVDFVDPLETSDGEALQIQLWRNAQIHVHVERIVMCLEGPRRGAARNRMQHGRFNFEKAACIEKGAQVTHDPRTRFEHATRLFVHDQIDVTAAIAHFRIGDAVPFVGQRPQRLGQQYQALHPH